MSACGGIGPLVATGDLYAARRAALDHCAASAPDHSWLHQAADAAATCVAAWRAAVDTLHEDGDGWAAISDAHRLRAPRVRAMTASMRDCATDSEDVIASWDECCSAHVRSTPGRACGPTTCCTFGNGTKNYLKLPLLREISISLALPSGDLLTIEQASAPYPRVAISVSHHHFFPRRTASSAPSTSLPSSGLLDTSSHSSSLIRRDSPHGAANESSSLAPALVCTLIAPD